MNARLVALDEGPDIDLDRAMVVVGRHPACDARLDSLRVSRHHCCMMPDNGEVLIRDLGSTNGIRINGQRVEMGRIRVGDELSITHIRYKLETGGGHDRTLADSSSASALHVPSAPDPAMRAPIRPMNGDGTHGAAGENALAAAVRKVLPTSVAQRCKIEVIVRMDDESPSDSPSHSTPVGLSSSHAERVVE